MSFRSSVLGSSLAGQWEQVRATRPRFGRATMVHRDQRERLRLKALRREWQRGELH